MLEANLRHILASLSENDVVLDVGGWARPLRRANYVVDLMPYETRGWLGHLGEGPERFGREAWIVQDVSEKPLPFADKEVDFAVCSHLLEDVRDPVFVCRELSRVARRGYVEVPSRVVESTLGVEHRRYCGYYHHRWLVEMDDGIVGVQHKSPLLHASWRLHFPRRWTKGLREEETVSWLFWEGSLECRERIFIYPEDLARDLEQFVRRHGAYEEWRYRLHATLSAARRFLMAQGSG